MTEVQKEICQFFENISTQGMNNGSVPFMTKVQINLSGHRPYYDVVLGSHLKSQTCLITLTLVASVLSCVKLPDTASSYATLQGCQGVVECSSQCQ